MHASECLFVNVAPAPNRHKEVIQFWQSSESYFGYKDIPNFQGPIFHSA